MSLAAQVILERELLAVPELRQLVEDVTDLIKLEIVQTVRGVQAPLPASRPGSARSVGAGLGVAIGGPIG